MNRLFWSSLALTLSLSGLMVAPAFSNVKSNDLVCQTNDITEKSLSEQKQQNNKQYLKTENLFFQVICSEPEELPQDVQHLHNISNPKQVDIIQKLPMILEIF